MSDPRQEYADALAAYRDAMARLQEAKRHIPPSAKDRRKQRLREERAAQRAHYLANKEAIDAQDQIIAKALAIFHQKCKILDELAAANEGPVRVRLPVSYRINDGPPIGNDDE